MRDISVKVLNPEAARFGEKMMVCGARMTQRGHNIKTMDDFMELFNRSYLDSTRDAMIKLPHANIQRFSQICVVIVGASRRFLAQITRHQDDVHYISASLQYSDYTDNAAFCIPYELTVKDYMHEGQAEFQNDYYVSNYLASQKQAMAEYERAIKQGVDNDSAGYMMPHGLRNVLIIAATPWQWKHIISQRVCRRNTPETAYVLNLIWEQLWPLSAMFKNCGPDCMQPGGCREGKMACGHLYCTQAVQQYAEEHNCSIPTAYLDVNYPLIRQQFAPGCAALIGGDLQ